MPVTFTPQELVAIYEQRVEQTRREYLGNELRLAEVKADPQITGDTEAQAVKEIEDNLHVINNAHDVAEGLLKKARAKLPKAESGA